jgi:outer membrane protein assembly factor BamD (BamD/ComL family)
MFATKDYDSGMFYLRRKAYDSAIIYFRDVVKNYPNARKTRQAYLRLVDAYTAIRYKDDVADVCSTLQKNYPGDREVRTACGSAPAAASTATTPTPAVPE